MLKFYEIEGRLPAYREEVPQAAVDYLGSLVKVAPALFAKYSWRGRTIEYHRSQIRRVYGGCSQGKRRTRHEWNHDLVVTVLAVLALRAGRVGRGWSAGPA